MKHLLTMCALLWGVSSSACDLVPEFEEVRTLALTTQDEALIRSVSVAVGDLPAGTWARTYLAKYHTVLSPNMCQLTPLFRRKVMAHELGHVVAEKTYPFVHEKDALMGEQLADYYGSKILGNSESHAIVDASHTLCGSDDPHKNWYCQNEMRWQYAMTH